MRTIVFSLLSLTLVVVAFGDVPAAPGGGDPVSLITSQGKINGNQVTVPIANNTMSPVTVTVQALYDDGFQVHSGASTLSLGPKGTGLVTISVQTITDDIDPQLPITENPDPVPNAIAVYAHP